MPSASKSQSKVLAAFLAFVVIGTVIVGTIAWNYQSANEEKQASVTPTPEPMTTKEIFYQSIGTTNINGALTTANKSPNFNKAYAVEFMLTESKAEAEAMVERLLSAGIQSYYMPIHREGVVYYKVRSAVFADQKRAASMAKRVQTSQKIEAKVMPL